MEITRKFAILAPVPEIHLISGLDTITAQLSTDEETSPGLPRIALGSMAFEVFRKADELRGDRGVEVLIYASEAQGDQPLNPEVGWRARYVGHLPSRNGRYPGKRHCRPASTATEKPIWAIYWEIQELERLKKSAPIATLQGLGQKTAYKSRFIPDAPQLIEYPFAAILANSR